ncbi:hypothetical protein D3C86_1788750 [compost metagenome]
MVSLQLGANFNQVVFRYAKLDELRLRLNICDGKVAAHCLGGVLHLGSACTELKSDIAVLLFSAMSNDLAVVETQYGYRDMLTGVVVDAGHPNLLCNYT